MSTDETDTREGVGRRDTADDDAPVAAASGPADSTEPADESAIPGTRPTADPEHHRRKILKRVLIGAGILSLILALIVGGGIWFLTERWAGNIDRVPDVFAGIDPHTRPAPATSEQGGDPVTFLLVGSDTRADTPQGEAPDSRSDAIMIARLSGDRQHAQLISIPRDSWVDIPGHGKNKINASYAFGGPGLLIQTVEQLTHVRIDHYVAIDFNGIAQVTDALGGVDVRVAETTTNGGYTFTQGINHITGETSRWYLGQRYGLQGGDFDRVKRQQQYLRAVFSKLFSAGTFTDPGKLDDAMLAVTSAVKIDDSLSNTDLLGLAYAMRNVTPKDVNFFTAPVLGTGREGAASVVYLDNVTGQRMWDYLQSDSLSENAAEFDKQKLPDVPR